MLQGRKLLQHVLLIGNFQTTLIKTWQIFSDIPPSSMQFSRGICGFGCLIEMNITYIEMVSDTCHHYRIRVPSFMPPIPSLVPSVSLIIIQFKFATKKLGDGTGYVLIRLSKNLHL